MATGDGDAAANILEENKVGDHWESLPQNLHVAIDAYFGCESRDDWIVVNTTISDSESLVDFVDNSTTVS
jgi:hypothetical protein